jgi:hypothetical protein
MATTTPNYGWDVPTSSDYVKDGALAIETLGDDIDASLFSVTSGKNVGSVPLITSTFTSAGSVTIDSVFSANFQNYMIYLNYKGTASANLNMQLRAGGVTQATQYYLSGTEVQNGSATVTGFNAANAGSFDRVCRTDAGNEGNSLITLFSPQTASIRTLVNWQMSDTLLNRNAGGFLNATTQFDGVIFFPGSGTITGTIRIFGMRNP